MLTLPEIINSTRGTYRLLRFDPAGSAYFDNTVDAFWRSFRVMVLVAPIYLIVRLIAYQDYKTDASEVEVILVETLYYVIQWFLYPVLLWEAARFLDLQRNYLRYVVAVNWINPSLILLVLLVAVMREIAPVIHVALVIGFWMLLAIWFTAATRLVLGAGWGITVALFAVDIVLSESLSLFMHRILGLERI